jgi:hypothetical protein
MKYILLTCNDESREDEIEVCDINAYFGGNPDEDDAEEYDMFCLVDDLVAEVKYLESLVVDLRQEVDSLTLHQRYSDDGLCSNLGVTSYWDRKSFKKYQEYFDLGDSEGPVDWKSVVGGRS